MPRVKTPNISESLVVASLIIKVAQFIGEETQFKSQYPGLFQFASNLSLILFGLSLVLWLNSSRKGLEKVDTIAQNLEELKTELDKVDRIARYDRGPVHLADLLRSKGVMHGQAGGETLSEVLLNIYSAAAEDLVALTRGTKDHVEFIEYHLVDKFLLNLMKVLPHGSVWLGTTRLQSSDAWQKGSAEPSYFEFQELVERRTRRNEVAYFRLWCLDSEERRLELLPLIKSQGEAGIYQRTLVSSGVPDMSLIWIPRDSRQDWTVLDQSQGFFTSLFEARTHDALCGIEFRARGGKELDAMTLHAPKSDEFTRLRSLFVQKWNTADAVMSTQERAKKPGVSECK